MQRDFYTRQPRDFTKENRYHKDFKLEGYKYIPPYLRKDLEASDPRSLYLNPNSQEEDYLNRHNYIKHLIHKYGPGDENCIDSRELNAHDNAKVDLPHGESYLEDYKDRLSLPVWVRSNYWKLTQRERKFVALRATAQTVLDWKCYVSRKERYEILLYRVLQRNPNLLEDDNLHRVISLQNRINDIDSIWYSKKGTQISRLDEKGYQFQQFWYKINELFSLEDRVKFQKELDLLAFKALDINEFTLNFVKAIKELL